VVGCALLAAWAPIAGGQSADFTSIGRPDATVSVRELKIPGPAHDEYERGRSRLGKRDFAGSLRHFATAIQLFPDYYEAYYLQGVANMRLDHDRDAMQEFQKAIDLSEGRCGRAEFGYGLVLERLGQAGEAEPIVRRGLETEPNNPDGYVVLSVVLLSLHRTDEAEKSAREALRFNDSRADKAYLVLADIHAARRDYLAQLQDLNVYIKAHPRDPSTSFLRAARDVAKRIAKKTAAEPGRAESAATAER
jgi:tetratricopeptide (TPR) repeat protein